MERLSMMGSSGRARVAEPAPRFTCNAILDGRIKEISSRSLMNDRLWVILIFFPNAWSNICPGEIKAFDAKLNEFSARGAAVLFASTDSEYVLRAWNNTAEEEAGLGNVSIPLVSDSNHRLSRDYGVLVEEEGIAQRAVFIIDPIGIIRSVSVNDPNVGRSVDEVARQFDALKFTDEFGQGCPVDWKSGEEGIALIVQKSDSLETQTPVQYPPQIADATAEIKRPTVARGVSWTTAPWAKGGRPKSSTPSSGPNTPGPRPKSFIWNTNEDAIITHS